MTVIAWDGQTLAADRKMSWHGAGISITKIARLGDCLVGVSGQVDFLGKFSAWFMGGADPTTYQIPSETSVVMLVRPDRSVEIYERTGYPVRIIDKKLACGCGKDFALAAMHLGHDARTAVEVACVFDNACGNGIDTLTLEEE